MIHSFTFSPHLFIEECLLTYIKNEDLMVYLYVFIYGMTPVPDGYLVQVFPIRDFSFCKHTDWKVKHILGNTALKPFLFY